MSKRTVKAMCKSAIATLSTVTILSNVDWELVISVTVMTGILSILTSIVKYIPEEPEEQEEKEDDNNDS